MSRSRKTTAVSIRFEENQKERLQQAAEDLHMKPSDVVRLALDQFLDELDRNGQVVLPVRRSEKLVAEGRGNYPK